MKVIKFSISKTGVATLVDALGFGAGCTAATSNLERRLGAVDEGSRAATEGMYEASEGQQAENKLE